MKYVFLLFIIIPFLVQAVPLKIGHRGACGYEPENTLRSFAKAIEQGVDVIELDVYVCTTGELVVIHDRELERTTNGFGFVFEKTLNELKSLDAGNGEKIPTLKEVFDFVDHRVIIDIELKCEGAAGAVAELIKYYVQEKGWACDEFVVTSFNHYFVREFHELLPQVSIGAILDGVPIKYAEFASRVGAQIVVLKNFCVDSNFLEDAHRRGLKVFVYTVNSHEEIDRMVDLGVDGLISNYPDRLPN